MLDKLLAILGNDKDPNNAEDNQKKNLTVISVGLTTILIFLIILLGDDNKKKEDVGDFKIVNEEEMAKTKWVGQAATEVAQSKKSVQKVLDENRQLKKELNQMKQMIIEIKQNLKEQKNNNSNNQSNLNQNKNQVNLYQNYPLPPTLKDKQNPNDYGVKKFGVVPKISKTKQFQKTPIEGALVYTKIATKEENKTKQVDIKPLKVLPTGSITKVTLLGGMDAPTMAAAKNNPLPVLMRINDLSFLPNQWKYDIQDCFILGEGYGDLSSERAYIRTTTLSCVTNNGFHIDTPLKGVVYGEDGKVGLRGRVVTKQGALIGRTLIAGFLQGISEAFKQSNTMVSVSPTGTTSTIDPKKALQTGLFGGASKATEKLADFYLKMADQIAPVIEISAGRKIEVITTDLTELKAIEFMKKGKK